MFGLGTTDQLLPFQDSARVCWKGAGRPVSKYEPTAVQAVAEVQETPNSLLLSSVPASGLGTTDHLLPFQDSTRVPLAGGVTRWCEPTAVQAVAETQDTLARSALRTFCGLGATDQVLPFQISVIGFSLAVQHAPKWPTAAQNAAVTQETPNRKLTWPVPGLGLGTIDQAVPFQVSISVRYDDRLLGDAADHPTAVQALADTQETPCSSSRPALLGLGTIDQAVPFQRSTRVLGSTRVLAGSFLAPEPTAIHDAADRQVTPTS